MICRRSASAEDQPSRACDLIRAARKDSAVHVSLSSDSPVKQPEGEQTLSLQSSWRAAEAYAPDYWPEAGHRYQ
jgi:hypothetical protein